MRRSILATLFCLSIQCLDAQAYYFKGEWTEVQSTIRFTGTFKITIRNNNLVSGELLWTFIAADSTSAENLSFYAGKKGRMGIEYVSGTYNPSTNDMYFEGTEKKDPYEIIGLDKYYLKLSYDKLVLHGKTDSNGKDNGLFYAARLTGTDGAKIFAMQKESFPDN